ncbi:phenazine biosynthesis FMN-dependent oxidase PhzG [Burkholderia cepacia]|uniref:phenazine biosynthesis FMN-dependent oxidase PhzG n=1 Tax=Burkholderia cepacia TaxID=292 RepID=UPI001CF123E0|nr:phenazine biosynthesis FMN-dependent oxidase PhzG [Burkholderia cepacia]MCA7933422.1 phenazine biosynthesis FMN-dependent oxidase PhzG [Burkholderia cepacia]
MSSSRAAAWASSVAPVFCHQENIAMNTSRFESLTGRVDVLFPEYDDPPSEPITLLKRWLAVADAAGVREPKALALATATSDGRMSSRIIAFSSIDDRGVIFCTHSTSRKGRELTETGWASGLLYWRETGQQIMISGQAVPLEESENDKLWFGRSVPMHAMSSASHQSDELVDREALLAHAAELLALGVALPRPPRFVGYRLEPHEMEFWAASSDRLHRRLRYERNGDDWKTMQLQP